MSKQQIALITRGSRELGRNMALAIANKNIDVVLTYNSNKEKADEVVQEIRKLGRQATALQLDTSDVNSFDGFTQSLTEALIEKTGSPKFDFLINNAGTALYAPIIQNIRAKAQKDIWLFGGAGLISSLLNLDLVDEIRIGVNPVILGEGNPVFKHIRGAKKLDLIKTKVYQSGVIGLYYRPVAKTT